MGHWTARIISKRKELSFQEVSSPSLEVIKQRQITALQGCHGWSRYRLSGWCTGSLQALCPRGRWSSVASWGSRRSLFDLRDDFFHMSLRTKSVSSLFSLSHYWKLFLKWNLTQSPICNVNKVWASLKWDMASDPSRLTSALPVPESKQLDTLWSPPHR